MQDPKEKKGKLSTTELPAIPEKLYFSIGEVSRLCDLQSHVLRYWEQEFAQLSPTKRRGNRRNYRREDIELVRRIRGLLYDQGYTIEGARKQFAQESKRKHTPETTVMEVAALPKQWVQQVVQDLETVLGELA